MDYTQSNSYDTDAGTGHRLHEDAKAIPTVWSGKDANSILWSLMEIVNAAGLAPKQFNKADASTYGVLLSALRSAGVFQTPAQFDNTTKAATAAFVQRALGNFAGFNSYAVDTVLTAAHFGQLVRMTGATARTFTMPASGAALQLGACVSFFNAGTANMTVARAGADVIQVNSATITSIVLMPGDTLTLMNAGAGTWVAAGGSAALGYSGQFAASLATPGWRKLPSGDIEQWGQIVLVTSGAGVAATFPLSFPTACRGVVLTPNSSVSAPWYLTGLPTQGGFTAAQGFTGSTTYSYKAWGN
jgi:hypothetical protein